jgi:hypothetical protein
MPLGMRQLSLVAFQSIPVVCGMDKVFEDPYDAILKRDTR